MELGTGGGTHGGCRGTPAGPCLPPQEPRCQRCAPGAVPVSQQPLIILQQLPGALPPPAGPSPLRGAPHSLADLLELMMIQSSQLQQVLMNSLAVAALTSCGLGPAPAAAQVLAVPVQSQEEEEEAVVFHHHYIPCPGPAPVLSWPVPAEGQRAAAVRYLDTGPAAEEGQLRAVPPPPPPSATGTVGPSIPPASEYYDVVEEML
ncbi:proline-rich protein 29 [Dryobates pubescens]|uniref:proline-rich protein 29 n=1 Tax=Dryobates pubescens TaxID=118200 RepID=UPI0023BA1694|nr:proline-rich protein 29 [Dryobates pubescens]